VRSGVKCARWPTCSISGTSTSRPEAGRSRRCANTADSSSTGSSRGSAPAAGPPHQQGHRPLLRRAHRLRARPGHHPSGTRGPARRARPSGEVGVARQQCCGPGHPSPAAPTDAAGSGAVRGAGAARGRRSRRSALRRVPAPRSRDRRPSRGAVRAAVARPSTSTRAS
jgi:hypothetical protein